MESFELQSLKYFNDPNSNKITLSVIDQLKLPLELEYIPISTSQDAWNTIRLMQVRGAPLIAIVAVLGISVDANNKRKELNTSKLACDFLINQMTYLRTSRPTAVNLFRATDDLLLKVQNMSSLNMTSDEIINSFINASETLLAEDVATNKAIGDYGAKKILEIAGRDSIRVLTICNTGSLATAGYGTALGVVRSLHAMGKLEHVYACETRPYNQGARLTAFEIVKDKLPGTLIGDSMASALMAVKGVDCVVVGADRVTSNGDTANKIGTYQLAIAAKYHGIPFFTAVPTTTLDLTMSSGSEIFVEERPANELTSIFDRKIAPDGINVWNPSFDVTPCSLIRGVITEVGVAEASPDAGSDGIIDIPSFLASKGLAEKFSNQAKPVALPIGYEKLSESSIAKYVAKLCNVRKVLGISSYDDYQQLTVAEIGDGNLNFVYIISGPNHASVIVKQALPYIRCIGESWPLTLKRASFETNALREERRLASTYVPEVYHFEESKAVIVMRYIEPPHIILRKGFMQGMRFSTLADDLSTFLANTLFGTSAISLDGGTFRSKVAKWSENNGLCALTEKVIFTDPYTDSDYNRWTSPHLDEYVQAIKNDVALKNAAGIMKKKFVTSTEALIHGDLHSGSVMVKEGSTFVIDPEFAFYGPMGFDLGALLSNFLLAYYSQSATNGDEYAAWILNQMVTLYDLFERKFLNLWSVLDDPNNKNSGEIYKPYVFKDSSSKETFKKDFMRNIWRDTLGFTGCKMIRRIVGVAHVADLESIEDLVQRSECEKKCIDLARLLILASQSNEKINSINDLKELASRIYHVRDYVKSHFL